MIFQQLLSQDEITVHRLINKCLIIFLQQNSYQQVMITDTQNKIFSILKNTSSNLILKKGQVKLIYKTYHIRSQQALAILRQRAQINHPHIIKIYQVQISQQICGLAFQHYTQTLNNCFFQYQQNQNDQQIFNTFEPILQAIDHLLQNIGHLSNDFSLKNVVFSQNLQVKYLDNFFLQEQIHAPQQQKHQQKIYQKIALSIYSLLFPKENSKTWKNRLKIVKQRTSQQMYNFLASIFAKSLKSNQSTTQNSVNLADPLYPQKIKKIKKTKQKSENNFQEASSNCSNNSKQSIKKCKSKIKNQSIKNQKYYSGNSQHHQGKQNKIFQ